MKAMLRCIAWLLLMTMLLTALACGKAEENDPVQSTTASGAVSDATTEVTTAETQDPNTVPEIPDTQYTGFTYRVANGFVGDTKYTTDSMFNYAITGEVLEDAIYTRTVELEEKFDIKFENCDIAYQGVINSVNAGNDEFDLCTATLSNVMTVVNRKVVYDLHDIGSLNLEKAWWDQNAGKKLSLNGHLYYTFSDFLITGMDNGRAVYFNKTMRQELDLPDLYQMVREGTWTYDKMAEMAEVAQSDLNGDGRINEADRVGIANNATTIYEALLTGCDAELVKQGDDGIPYFFCLDHEEEFVNVYQSLLSTFTANDRLLITSDAEKMFTDEKVLFYVSTLSAAVRMRQFEMDLGILPVPKWDEKQENYLNVSPNGHALMIPNSVQNTERSGVILEALSYYSSKYHSDDAVMPAYFETALTARSARDDESAESLQIIHDNISYVIKVVGTMFSDMVYGYFNMENPNISSLLKSSGNAQKTKLEKVLTDFGG
jgi:ABC-type glycerol-3-phosphate transport system substrate-binding protein